MREGKTVKSLAAKWAPLLDKSFDRRTLVAESIARMLYPPHLQEFEGLPAWAHMGGGQEWALFFSQVRRRRSVCGRAHGAHGAHGAHVVHGSCARRSRGVRARGRSRAARARAARVCVCVCARSGLERAACAGAQRAV